MCTLIAIHRRVPGSPLVIAANRDEYLDRPSEGPRLRRVGDSWAVTPLDLRAGGSWLGVNARGVFAALTNVRTDAPDPSRKSRGMVVMDVLGFTGLPPNALVVTRADDAKFLDILRHALV